MTRKTVNAMGPNRLRIEPSCTTRGHPSKTTSTTTTTRRSRVGGGRSLGRRGLQPLHVGNVRGGTTAPTVACSSPPTQGRRGLDLQGSRHPVRPEGTRRPAGAVPSPRPLRVTLSEGAVIRSRVELSSNQIGRAPLGSVLTAVGKGASSKISKTGIASKLSTPSSDDEAKGGKAVRSPGICSNTRCYN